MKKMRLTISFREELDDVINRAIEALEQCVDNDVNQETVTLLRACEQVQQQLEQYSQIH